MNPKISTVPILAPSIEASEIQWDVYGIIVLGSMNGNIKTLQFAVKTIKSYSIGIDPIT